MNKTFPPTPANKMDVLTICLKNQVKSERYHRDLYFLRLIYFRKEEKLDSFFIRKKAKGPMENNPNSYMKQRTTTPNVTHPLPNESAAMGKCGEKVYTLEVTSPSL